MPVNKKYKKILTFGAFNPLHYGHINLFKNIKDLCSFLIVCVSDNEYIRKVKNIEPYLLLEKRINHVEAIKYVDKIDIQSLTFTKKDAVDKYKPNALVVGDDWTPKTYTGENLGVPVIYLPYTKGVSSTIIRKAINKS